MLGQVQQTRTKKILYGAERTMYYLGSATPLVHGTEKTVYYLLFAIEL